MSTVLWIRLESDPDDFIPDDLYELYENLDELDRHCQGLGVRALTDFVDLSDVEYNLSAGEAFDEAAGNDEEPDGPDAEDERWLEENARWVAPAELLETLNALREDLTGDESQDIVLEEIAQVIERCEEALHNEARVRLMAVM